MNKYMILMLICTMFSAVSQILLKQSANEEHASALREYLNWRVIVAYLIFGSVLLLNTYAYTQVDLKYRFVDVGEVPFVDTMEISLDDPHTLRISVTEKGILGSFYIDTLGQYAYFDKDGFVVETSSDVIEGVPKITGVTCDSVVLYEKLPLEDTKLLRNLLTLTQLLKKYELEPEEIHYDSAMQPQLTYGTIAVNVGSEDYLTQKIARLSAIMPQLSGLSGILHLETWTPDTTDIVFDRADL